MRRWCSRSNKHHSLADGLGQAFEQTGLLQLLERLRVYLGVEWIYEELAAAGETQGTGEIAESSAAPISHSQSAIPAPQPETIAALLKMAAIGDIEEIMEETRRLETSEPKYGPFVSQLRQFAKGFQVKQLKNFLKQYLAIDK